MVLLQLQSGVGPNWQPNWQFYNFFKAREVSTWLPSDRVGRVKWESENSPLITQVSCERWPQGKAQFHYEVDREDMVSLFYLQHLPLSFLCSLVRGFEEVREGEKKGIRQRERWHLVCEMRNQTILKLWRRISWKPVSQFLSLFLSVSVSLSLML